MGGGEAFHGESGRLQEGDDGRSPTGGEGTVSWDTGQRVQRLRSMLGYRPVGELQLF